MPIGVRAAWECDRPRRVVARSVWSCDHRVDPVRESALGITRQSGARRSKRNTPLARSSADHVSQIPTPPGALRRSPAPDLRQTLPGFRLTTHVAGSRGDSRRRKVARWCGCGSHVPGSVGGAIQHVCQHTRAHPGSRGYSCRPPEPPAAGRPGGVPSSSSSARGGRPPGPSGCLATDRTDPPRATGSPRGSRAPCRALPRPDGREGWCRPGGRSARCPRSAASSCGSRAPERR
jgi:hypothetical protein